MMLKNKNMMKLVFYFVFFGLCFLQKAKSIDVCVSTSTRFPEGGLPSSSLWEHVRSLLLKDMKLRNALTELSSGYEVDERSGVYYPSIYGGPSSAVFFLVKVSMGQMHHRTCSFTFSDEESAFIQSAFLQSFFSVEVAILQNVSADQNDFQTKNEEMPLEELWNEESVKTADVQTGIDLEYLTRQEPSTVKSRPRPTYTTNQIIRKIPTLDLKIKQSVLNQLLLTLRSNSSFLGSVESVVRDKEGQAEYVSLNCISLIFAWYEWTINNPDLVNYEDEWWCCGCYLSEFITKIIEAFSMNYKRADAYQKVVDEVALEKNVAVTSKKVSAIWRSTVKSSDGLWQEINSFLARRVPLYERYKCGLKVIERTIVKVISGTPVLGAFVEMAKEISEESGEAVAPTFVRDLYYAYLQDHPDIKHHVGRSR